MARKRRKTKTAHPSGRPQPEQQARTLRLGRRAPPLRAPRLPGHGMR